MSRPSIPELIRRVADQALRAADTLLPEWLPEGARQGREWVARNSVRGDRRAGSFGVSLDSGRWNDFADDSAHGGDLVSLLAYLQGCGQLEAAQAIDQRLALGVFNATGTAIALPRESEAERLVREARQRERLEQRQRTVAAEAARLWAMPRPADPRHAYLLSKDVAPGNLRQLRGGRLLVPLCLDGQLVNLQFIDSQGAKRFLSGGRVKGTYSPLGHVEGRCRLFVCEGWATGATLHAHTGCPVVCAMNAGNLKAVAMAMRAQHGTDVELVIAGDDDRTSTRNMGRIAANRAALAADALVVYPEWPANAPVELSDFNDLHLWRIGKYKESQA
ncbi:DNA primase [Pseudomonas aeruginosa]|uniref:toprim domain-containing protein n=1 Tax=Pseudomonas aeruginosa TaxID=287 RepID=UPI00190D5AAE|nr:toprim domain-containing protein [Pseudomonas aeruginosa]MBK3752264.1 DNA primase [Pseudomonas aeruginosa]MBK3762502.1 DNA primase [Pseudomonas aeruginosa]MBK3769042.1 DNA primase [Pseudomonas aeruginosa]MBK3789230.1 DNA primase [Pseudomonas aeruginosa]MBK3885276.1 DNA primase [Pseudomonas aeruginosa]